MSIDPEVTQLVAIEVYLRGIRSLIEDTTDTAVLVFCAEQLLKIADEIAALASKKNQAEILTVLNSLYSDDGVH